MSLDKTTKPKGKTMFLIVTTQPLNDGTKGFRFNAFGKKGMLRKRKHLSRGYGISRGKAMTALHLGKVTVYVENKGNKYSARQFRHFAG